MTITHSMMKRFSLFAASFLVAGMVFGIGLDSVFAIIPAQAVDPVETTDTQPATGREMYEAVENGSATINSAHAATDTTDGHATEHTDEHAEGAAAGDHTEDTGVVGMFGLDWKLFLAQLINFGIILFVLWKWVFGPVTKGLSERTAKIESGLADAQKIAEERQTFDSWKQGEISQVRTEAAGILTQAKQDAEKLKAETLAETKAEQEKIIANTQAKLEQEKQAMLESVRGELADLVIQSTERVIRQKLDPKKDAELIDYTLKSAKGGSNEV